MYYLYALGRVQRVPEVADTPRKKEADTWAQNLVQGESREDDRCRRTITKKYERHERHKHNHLPRHQVECAVETAEMT